MYCSFFRAVAAIVSRCRVPDGVYTTLPSEGLTCLHVHRCTKCHLTHPGMAHAKSGHFTFLLALVSYLQCSHLQLFAAGGWLEAVCTFGNAVREAHSLVLLADCSAELGRQGTWIAPGPVCVFLVDDVAVDVAAGGLSAHAGDGLISPSCLWDTSSFYPCLHGMANTAWVDVAWGKLCVSLQLLASTVRMLTGVAA